MKKVIAAASSIALAFGMYATPFAARAATPLSQIQAGDLIRGASFPAVYYYGADGFRYVFPNDKTYFTWYKNFSTVKYISDAEMGTIQIGGNVTYKPGVKMLKINSDPKTYAVDAGGTLRWVTSEAAAVALYGSSWNKMIDDVPDAFFSNYKHDGADVGQASDFDEASITSHASDIDRDKGLKAPTAVSIVNGSFSPSTITISVGTAVKFTNNGTMNHTATGDDLSWGTGTMTPGQSFSRYFKKAGTYTYACSIHPNMTGTIIVQ